MTTQDDTVSTGTTATRSRYQDLKDWIAAREAAEAESGRPVPLTDAQKRALAELRPESPLVDNENWVGLLQRYRDAHPDQDGVAWIDEDFVEVSGSGRWTSRCKIKEGTFPVAGFGLETDDELPTFSRKRDARQYAAKWAIRWLRQHSLMPDHGDEVKFPKPRPVSQAADVDVRDPSFPATQRVPILCHQLGFQPPQYNLQASETNPSLFSGFAYFRDVPGVPAKLGAVESVFGKKNAREKIAEQVLVRLWNVEEERKQVASEITSPVRSAESGVEDEDQDGVKLEEDLKQEDEIKQEEDLKQEPLD